MVSNAEIKTCAWRPLPTGTANPADWRCQTWESCAVLVCVCSGLLFGFLEFVEFKLKYVVRKSKARINPYLTFLSGVCYLFFQAICNLHMTHSKWEDRGFVSV